MLYARDQLGGNHVVMQTHFVCHVHYAYTFFISCKLVKFIIPFFLNCPNLEFVTEAVCVLREPFLHSNASAFILEHVQPGS